LNNRNTGLPGEPEVPAGSSAQTLVLESSIERTEQFKQSPLAITVELRRGRRRDDGL
jgi:hypothetical protein